MYKKYKLFSSLLLFSSTLAPLSAVPVLIERSADVELLIEKERSGYVPTRAKEYAEGIRLSNKGDLPSNPDQFQRRRFYMRGDGGCFFWAIPQDILGSEQGSLRHITREDAVQLWLAHSHDPIVRALCVDEIYDMFMQSLSDQSDHQNGLPEEMTQNEHYQSLSQLLTSLRVTRAEFDPTSFEYRDYLQIEEETKVLIREGYCKSEETFRDYVNYVLKNPGKYMILFQNQLHTLHPKYSFVNALAYILRKRLVVWNYNQSQTQLVQVHSYFPEGATGTWEVLQSGEHFNRVVPVTD